MSSIKRSYSPAPPSPAYSTSSATAVDPHKKRKLNGNGNGHGGGDIKPNIHGHGHGNGSGNGYGNPAGGPARVGGMNLGGGIGSAGVVGLSAGTDRRTQVLSVVDYLKANKGPQRVTEIALNFNLQHRHLGVLQQLVIDADFLARLVKEQGIRFNDKLELLEFVNQNEITTANDLLNHIRLFSAKPGGIPLKFIKDNYTGKDLLGHLEKWEKAGKILIMRTAGHGPLVQPGEKYVKNVWAKGADAGKETMMEQGAKAWKSVMWDEARQGNEDIPEGKVDDEFQQMWAAVETKPEDDLHEKLHQLGLKANNPNALDKPINKVVKKEKKKSKRKQDANKLTNVHMKELGFDFSQDFVPET